MKYPTFTYLFEQFDINESISPKVQIHISIVNNSVKNANLLAITLRLSKSKSAPKNPVPHNIPNPIPPNKMASPIPTYPLTHKVKISFTKAN